MKGKHTHLVYKDRFLSAARSRLRGAVLSYLSETLLVLIILPGTTNEVLYSFCKVFRLLSVPIFITFCSNHYNEELILHYSLFLVIVNLSVFPKVRITSRVAIVDQFYSNLLDTRIYSFLQKHRWLRLAQLLKLCLL